MAYQSSIYGNRKRNSRRRHSRRKRGSSRLSRPLLSLIGGLGVAAIIAGIGYVTVQDMNTAKPDQFGCYAQPGRTNSTTVLVDSSDPGFDAVQSRDLIHALTNIFQHDLAFNEHFSLITTQESRIGSIPAPVVERCATAKSPNDLKEIGAASVTQAFLTRQSEQDFKKYISPVLDDVFSPHPTTANRQSRESPILEQIQNLSRLSNMSNGRHGSNLIVVSDMMQNTPERQFCSTQGHLPSFEKFKQHPQYDRLKPQALTNTDVTVYMLIRASLGHAPFAFCTEDELTRWWRDYFIDAGASSINFIRIRPGS